MHKVIFLDRDGTINVDSEYVYRIQDWQFTDRAAAALKRLAHAGYKLVVITNQGGIAQALYTLEDMEALHDHMETELEKEGVTLDAVIFCPHGRDATCDCRKPGIGMARQAEEQIGPIDYAVSWTIGDKEADVGFGTAAGTKTALVRSRYWEETELTQQPDMIVDSLWEFATKITS